MNSPIISVVMPVYNGEKYLKESIDSVLNQTFSDFEFIILNDGSTDKTEEIILSYVDKRIVYVKNLENLKIVKTLNKGIRLAKGKYIARMDADDICLPERFAEQIKFMSKNPDVDVCGSWLQTFGHNNSIWRHPLTHNKIKIHQLFDSALMHPTILAKKTFFENLKYDEKMVGAEDYYLWVKGVDKYCYANIPKILLKYRIHNSHTDTSKKIKNAEICRKIMLEKIGCKFSDDEFKVFSKLHLCQKINNNDLLYFLNKLLSENQKTNYFQQQLLIKLFSAKVLSVIEQDAYNLKLLLLFYKTKKILPSLLPIFSIRYIKFIVKCLISYKSNRLS